MFYLYLLVAEFFNTSIILWCKISLRNLSMSLVMIQLKLQRNSDSLEVDLELSYNFDCLFWSEPPHFCFIHH